MPRPRNPVPAYCKHRGGGQAVITLNGKDHHLGKYGTKPSRDRYDRLKSEGVANGRRLARPGFTVNKLLLLYFNHARRPCEALLQRLGRDRRRERRDQAAEAPARKDSERGVSAQW